MSNDQGRIIPPGQFGSAFMDRSGSMSYDDNGFGDGVGTSFPTRLESVLAAIAAESKPSPLDGHVIVITDGEPPALSQPERAELVRKLLEGVSPFNFVSLDSSGAVSNRALGDSQDCPAACTVSGNGLLPVPSASELVSRICGSDTDVAPVDTDKCCGCGGCDKAKS